MSCAPTTIRGVRCVRVAPDCWATLDSEGNVTGWYAELGDVEAAIGGRV